MERALAREQTEKERKSYTFYPGSVRIPEGSAPHTKNRSYSITAEVEIPAGGAEGPICAIGDQKIDSIIDDEFKDRIASASGNILPYTNI